MKLGGVNACSLDKQGFAPRSRKAGFVQVPSLDEADHQTDISLLIAVTIPKNKLNLWESQRGLVLLSMYCRCSG